MDIGPEKLIGWIFDRMPTLSNTHPICFTVQIHTLSNTHPTCFSGQFPTLNTHTIKYPHCLFLWPNIHPKLQVFDSVGIWPEKHIGYVFDDT